MNGPARSGNKIGLLLYLFLVDLYFRFLKALRSLDVMTIIIFSVAFSSVAHLSVMGSFRIVICICDE